MARKVPVKPPLQGTFAQEVRTSVRVCVLDFGMIILNITLTQKTEYILAVDK